MYEFSVKARSGLCQSRVKYLFQEDNSIEVIRNHAHNSGDLGGALTATDFKSSVSAIGLRGRTASGKSTRRLWVRFPRINW